MLVVSLLGCPTRVHKNCMLAYPCVDSNNLDRPFPWSSSLATGHGCMFGYFHVVDHQRSLLEHANVLHLSHSNLLHVHINIREWNPLELVKTYGQLFLRPANKPWPASLNDVLLATLIRAMNLREGFLQVLLERLWCLPFTVHHRIFQRMGDRGY